MTLVILEKGEPNLKSKSIKNKGTSSKNWTKTREA